MATCPRCYGPLNDHHRCRPRWIRRALRKGVVISIVALFGALVSIAFWPHHLPLLGLIIGGAVGYGFAEAIRPE
jgi:hypothetical protein